MLTTRSKVLVTVTAGSGLTILVIHALSAGVWNPETDAEAEDWYIGWIILGALVLVSIVSILIDIRRNRVSS
ncbi:MAG: hypothetical protein LAO23_13380 [Acidobacteriia bacterium]|nr:hypothetical protein [Terriglobia bacterium]